MKIKFKYLAIIFLSVSLNAMDQAPQNQPSQEQLAQDAIAAIIKQNTAASAENLKLIHDLLLELNDNHLHALKIDGQPAIHYAARHGMQEVVSYLINLDRNMLNLKDSKDNTPIMRAAQSEQLDIIIMLIERGADKSGLDPKIILKAKVKRFITKAVKKLIVKVRATIKRKKHNARFSRSFYQLVQNRKLGLVRKINNKKVKALLTNCIVDPAKMNYRLKPSKLLEDILLKRITKKTPSKVEAVLNQGANPNLIIEGEFIPLTYILAREIKIKLLKEKLVVILMKYILDVNVKDGGGDTPLHWAAVKGYLDILGYFFANGGDINAKNNDGDTPLHLAAEHGHLNVFKYLHANGGDINAKNDYGDTPLHLAARSGHLDIVKYIHANGVNIDVKDNDGCTPLMWAIREGHLDIIQYLLANRANFNAKDNNGNTPLMWAILNKYVKIAEYLIRNWTNINDPNQLHLSSIILSLLNMMGYEQS